MSTNDTDTEADERYAELVQRVPESLRDDLERELLYEVGTMMTKPSCCDRCDEAERGWVDRLVGLFDDSPLNDEVLQYEREARERMDKQTQEDIETLNLHLPDPSTMISDLERTAYVAGVRAERARHRSPEWQRAAIRTALLIAIDNGRTIGNEHGLAWIFQPKDGSDQELRRRYELVNATMTEWEKLQ